MVARGNSRVEDFLVFCGHDTRKIESVIAKLPLPLGKSVYEVTEWHNPISLSTSVFLLVQAARVYDTFRGAQRGEKFSGK